MKWVTRRTALTALSAGTLGSLVTATQAAPPEASALRQELFVVGPFSLGNWFKKYREERNSKRPIVSGAPDDAEIIHSLNECKLYVIDRRVWKDKDTVRFDDSPDGYPKLVAEGKLVHSWKDRGKNCTIWLIGMILAGSDTEHATPPPFRELVWNVTIEIRGENGILKEAATHSFTSDGVISYDITGKHLLSNGKRGH